MIPQLDWGKNKIKIKNDGRRRKQGGRAGREDGEEENEEKKAA